MSVTLTFGKHKDKALAEIPRGYLEWLVGEGIKSPKLAEAVAAELMKRDASADPFGDPAPTTATTETGSTPRPTLEAALAKLLAATAEIKAAVEGTR